MEIKDYIKWQPRWTIQRYASEEDFARGCMYNESEIPGNLLLNEGITELLTLLIGGTATAFSNANTYFGVGDSNTAASATQTGLQASTNKKYNAMAATYPQVSNQTVSFQAVFASGDANYSWQEFTIANGSSDTGKNLNRKVSDQGTKVSGQVTITLAITLS